MTIRNPCIMRNRENGQWRATTWLLLFFVPIGAAAQSDTTKTGRDTTYIISSTTRPQATAPLNLEGKPFYNIIRPNQLGLQPTALYSRDDRLFVGLNYNRQTKDWNPDTSGYRHRFYVHYSINQNAFSTGYQAIYHRLIGDINLFVDAGYDWVKWINFYGLGNETKEENDSRNYYRIRHREALVDLVFQKRLGKQSSINVTPFYQRIHLLPDEGRFLSNPDGFTKPANTYVSRNYAGLRTEFQWQRVDNVLVPTRGLVASAGLAYTKNFGTTRHFITYGVFTRLYVPLSRHLVFSTINGAAAQTGRPEFFQMISIGGSTLRGHRRERFRGETIYHNNNELQYLFDFNKGFYKGRLGFTAFADQGRVWKRGEHSDLWHYGYGGGVILVPYRKVFLSLQYGFSKERRAFHIEFRRAL